jgi:hypothetical protein
MFLVGVPLAWAVLLLFHPGGDPDTLYQDLRDEVTATLAVHIGMMIFIPLMAVVVYLLLRGVEGTLRGLAESRWCPSWSSTARGRRCWGLAPAFSSMR